MHFKINYSKKKKVIINNNVCILQSIIQIISIKKKTAFIFNNISIMQRQFVINIYCFSINKQMKKHYNILFKYEKFVQN